MLNETSDKIDMFSKQEHLIPEIGHFPMKITNSDKFYPTLYWIVKQCLYFPYKHSLRIRFINAYYINIKHRNGIKYAETNKFGKKRKGK